MAGMRIVLPDASRRSNTAVEGKSALRDDHVFSALVFQHGGTGQSRTFTVPYGQAIPTLAGSGVSAPAPAHLKTFYEGTTNLSKAGEFGSAIGEVGVRAIGITLDQAAFNPVVTGAQTVRAYGATQFEVSDILSKTFFQLKVGGVKAVEGLTWMFPAAGGAQGSVAASTTANNSSVVASMATNGWPGMPRRLKIPILIGRSDTVEGIVGIGGSQSLAFSVTSADGQPVLAWYTLVCAIKSDIRG